MRVLLLFLSFFLLGIILTHSGVVDALVLFMTIGAVPGTSFSISPLTMLGFILAILWLCFVNLSDALYRSKIQ